MNKLILMGVVVACLGFSVLSAHAELVGDLNQAKAFATTQILIERLRVQEKPDWSEIQKEYDGLAPLVQEVDQLKKTGCHAENLAALEKCARGERIDVNQQIVAKTLQLVAVLAMTSQLEKLTAGDPAEREKSVEIAAAYFEGIRPTLVRRDKDIFEGKRTLEPAADEALARLKKSAPGDDMAGAMSARRELEDVIMRTYALSLLREFDEIEKKCQTDREFCDVKRAEGLVFYRILEPWIKKRHAAEDKALTAMLNGGYENMSSKLAEGYISRGLDGLPLK